MGDLSKADVGLNYMRKVIQSYKHEVNANREPSKVVARCTVNIPGHKPLKVSFKAESSKEFLEKLIGWSYAADHASLKHIVGAQIEKAKTVMRMIQNLPT